jgi:hypothetical protein
LVALEVEVLVSLLEGSVPPALVAWVDLKVTLAVLAREPESMVGRVSAERRRTIEVIIGSYLAATLNMPPSGLLLDEGFCRALESWKAVICGFLSEPLA